jgi:hypothetical protein
MELLLNQEQVAISLLDAQAQKLMENFKELYVEAEAHADATIKQQEDLNGCTIAISQQERLVVEWEQKLQEREKRPPALLNAGKVSSRPMRPP